MKLKFSIHGGKKVERKSGMEEEEVVATEEEWEKQRIIETQGTKRT